MDNDKKQNTPLADRARPKSFDDMVGQSHLVGEKGSLRAILKSNKIPSMVFFGPPGCGKTTAASIIARSSGMEIRYLNATTAGIADIRKIVEETEGVGAENGILLYLDEIQYFNKKQQQSLLNYIEDGRITLISSTTENPYYYIYDALLSRLSVFEFKNVTAQDIKPRIITVFGEIENKIVLSDDGANFIAGCAGGDVRHALTMLELAVNIARGNEIGIIDEAFLRTITPSVSAGRFDADGDVHYDLLSCLQKSIRGSDPDAALFYLAKLLEGGDIISPCRRLMVIASEDIGQAYPMAAVIVRACVESAKELGLPEARIPLANACVTLATAPKSNTAYMGINLAAEDIRRGMGTNIPEILKSPFFKGYSYPHDFVNDYCHQEYLPEDLQGKHYYNYGENKTEQAAKAYWDKIKAENDRKKR